MLKAIIFFLEIKQSFNQKIDNLVKNALIKIKTLINFFVKIINQNLKTDFFWKNILLFFTIIAIFNRSIKDLGHESVANIAYAKYLLNNLQYHNLFDQNSPLIVILNLISISISKLFDINELIFSNFFSLIFGIISIIISSKILFKFREKIGNDVINILIISFSIGYFFRVFNNSYNEFCTINNYLVGLIYLYLCINISVIFEQNKKSNFYLVAISTMIICLKPVLIIAIVICEVYRIYLRKSKNIKHDIIGISLIISFFLLYSFIISLSNKQLFLDQFIVELRQVNIANFAYIIKNHLALILLFCVINIKQILKNKLTKLSLINFSSFSLIFLNDNHQDFDQISIFYSLQLPILIIVFYNLIKSSKVNFKNYWFIIFIIVISSLLNPIEVFNIARDMIYFWFILLIIAFRYNQNHSLLNDNEFVLLDKILINLKKPKILITFLSVSALIIYQILKIEKISEISWLVNFCLTIYSILIYQNLKQNKTTKINIAITFLAFFTYFGYVLNDFRSNSESEVKFLKTPNFTTDELMLNLQNLDQSKILSISKTNYGKNIINKNQLKTENYLIDYDILFKNIEKPEKYQNQAKLEIDSLIRNLKEDKIEGIILQIIDPLNQDFCTVNFLEFYLRDQNFREFFVKNFEFKNRIKRSYFQKNKIKIQKDIIDSNSDKTEITIEDYEIYRKK